MNITILLRFKVSIYLKVQYIVVALENFMTFEEALRLIDDQVSAKIGRRLTRVEKIVLEAAWENEGYEKVANKSEYESNYLRGQVAPKLWMLLSPIIGDGAKVTKKKLRLILENTATTPNLQPLEQLNTQELETLIPTSPTKTQVQLSTSVASETLVQGQSPDVSSFCGRKAELRELKQLVVSNRCVVLYGPAGIGKSALAARLVEEIEADLQPQFDCVIWKSVCYAPSLDSLIVNLLKTLQRLHNLEQELPKSIQDKTSLLVEYLQKSRCLLILDGAEVWLSSDRNKNFNVYSENYSEYSLFFRRLVEEKYHSCILLTSQEPFKDMMKLQNSGRPSYSLKTPGLDLQGAKAILRNQNLTDEHKWESLLEPYLGNPSAIKRVACKIERFFGGDVAKFLNHKTALTSEIYKDILLQQCQPGRLTFLEKQILLYLVEKTIDAPIGVPNINTFTQLVSDMQAKAVNAVSLSKIMEAVDDLDHRSLVVVNKDNQTKELLFDLPVLTKDYIFKGKLIESLDINRKEERAKILDVANQLFNPSQTSENFAV